MATVQTTDSTKGGQGCRPVGIHTYFSRRIHRLHHLKNALAVSTDATQTQTL